MNTATLTDDAQMAAAMKARADAVLAMLPLIATDPVEQAACLLAAAAAVIERTVGRHMAAPALMALVQPTIDDWHTPMTAARQ